MDFDLDELEDRLLARYQEAVADGLLAWAGIIGDESEAHKAPKLPAVSILHRRGGFTDPETIDVLRQTGMLTWSVFAVGSNLRERGIRSGRRGATGAYHALMIAIRYGQGFIMTTDPDEGGWPLFPASYDLAALDQKSQRAMYEIEFRHEWSLVQFGYE